MKQILILLLIFLSSPVVAQKVTFGIISDVHQDLQKDATSRLETFISHASKQKNCNFIISLGDLSHSTGSDAILKVWNSYQGPKYHTLGNHDMDNATKAAMVAKYEMSAPYYSFDKGGVHFVVLDCAFTRKNGQVVDYDNGNYYVGAEDRDLISSEQLAWLEQDLTKTTKPTIIFSHPAFDEIGASVPNRQLLRDIVKKANQKTKKVAALICGHHHIDAHSVIDGVDYLQINSASYLWLETGKKYSSGNMAEYDTPVFAMITVDPKKRTITVKGQQEKFRDPAPEASDFTAEEWANIYPGIRDRVINY